MPDAYHHGDLRRALLRAATDLLDAGGVAGLSLRDLARRTGVSPTAPYHYFPSKADLVTALADDAMADLDAVLADADACAVAEGAHASARLGALGVAYVLFAVDHPERFRLAFRPEMGAPLGHLDDASRLETVVGFRCLYAVVTEMESEPARRRSAALRAWSHAHGLAALLVDGPLRPLAARREQVRALATEILAAPNA